MNIATAIDQATVLHDLVATYITYLGSVKTANTFADVEGKTAGLDNTLHDDHTWYGISATIVEKISQAKDIVAECTALVLTTQD
jgi:hypothetical protein